MTITREFILESIDALRKQQAETVQLLAKIEGALQAYGFLLAKIDLPDDGQAGIAQADDAINLE